MVGSCLRVLPSIVLRCRPRGPALDGGAWRLFPLSVFVDFVTSVSFVLKIVTREVSVTAARR
jgi:hypothetical protein